MTDHFRACEIPVWTSAADAAITACPTDPVGANDPIEVPAAPHSPVEVPWFRVRSRSSLGFGPPIEYE
jgi:hypothetical protein